mmetsp:Transcript_15540/g.26338  ORF Transcript_15540/g.26338 Transcript_15540/m.26338 type:complete len:170 (-) Transcript_15540:125-634(-)
MLSITAAATAARICSSRNSAAITAAAKTLTRHLATSHNFTDQDESKRFHPVYVHHLSKVVLEHLQNNRNDWVVGQGLESGLRLNPDGTFVLHFPTGSSGVDGGRIWTSYDGGTKQHWLSVYRGKVVGRFMIKDSSLLNNNDAEVNDRVRECVDQMIVKLTDIESSMSTP